MNTAVSRSLVAFNALLVLLAGVAAFGVYDVNTDTDTIREYRQLPFFGQGVNITFAGNGLTLKNAQNGSYSLTNNSGTNEVVGQFSSGNLSTSGVPEGRYVVNNTSSSKSYMPRVDVVSNSSDVTGRIDGSGVLSQDLTDSPEIDLYYWLNSSEIPESAYTVSVTNLTGMNNGPENDERLYRMNASGLDRFWLSVDEDGFGERLKSSRGFETPFSLPNAAKPRINDVALQGSYHVSGNVTNATGVPQGGLKMVLERVGFSSARSPYIAAPPIRTDFTNSSGAYNFTGLEPARYSVRVANYSASNRTYSAFRPNAEITFQNGSAEDVDFNFTSSTGNVTAELVTSGSAARYAVGVFSRAYQDFEPMKSAGTVTVEGVPDGTYNVLAAKFDSSGNFLASTSVPDVTVSGNDPGPIEVGFPPTVEFNGTVVNGTGSAVAGAEVLVEKKSERIFARGTTNSSGEFSVQVKNDTLYNVTVSPPDSLRDEYGTNETNYTVKAPFSRSKNFTLPSGATLQGYVNGSSGPVEATVFAGNRSERTFGSTETNASGYYSLSGLEKGVEYRLKAFPDDPSEGSNSTTVLVDQDTVELDIQLSSTSYRLNGTVTDSNLEPVASQVEVESLGGSFNDTALTNSSDSSFDFGSLRGGEFYRVEVQPEGFPERTRFVSLDSNTTLNFTFEQQVEADGYVNSTAGADVENARVLAFNRSQRSFDTDLTDSSGYYRLELANASHEVRIRPSSGLEPKTTSLAAEEVTNGPLDRNFTLSTGVSLEGNVSGTDGYDQLSGYVNLRNESEDASAYTEFSGGSYELDGLKNVSYDAYVAVENDSYVANSTSVPGSEMNSSFNFTVQSTSNGRRIGVTVEEEGGGTLEEAEVHAAGTTFTTDSEGVAVIPRKPNTTQVDIVAEKEGYDSASQALTVKDRVVSTSFGTEEKNWQNVTLALTDLTSESFDLDVGLNYTGGDDSGRTVVFTSNRSGEALTSVASTGEGGDAKLSDLVTGDYLVTVVIDDTEINRTTTSLERGESTTLSDSLDPDYNLSYEVPSQ